MSTHHRTNGSPAERYPGAYHGPALAAADSGFRQSFPELDHAANRLSDLLWQRQIRPGDPVAIMLDNHDRYLEILWGCHYAGTQYIALSNRLTPGEVETILRDAGARAVITSAARAASLPATLPDSVRLRLSIDGNIAGFDNLTSLEPTLNAAAPTDRQRVAGVDLLYSSGTTGKPKGIVRDLTPGPLETAPVGLSYVCKKVFGFAEGDTYLSVTPLYHAGPLRLALGAQALGAQVVVAKKFDAERTLQLIEQHQVTHTFLVPTMMSRLLALPDDVRSRYDLSSLRSVLHSAAPCPIPVKEAFIDWFGPVVDEFYSGTEGNAMTFCTAEQWLAHPGTVGRPVGCEIHICDEEGRELPVGESGAVYFDGGVEFSYRGDEEKTADSRHARGWASLGDIGRIDDDGFLYLTDRKSNVIISGGVNIYPQEVENLLTVHPEVEDVAVFGVPNADFGEEVKAVVHPRTMPATSDEVDQLARTLIAYCREHLADIKCPRTVDFRTDLPREPTGKLLKRTLRDQYWTTESLRQ